MIAERLKQQRLILGYTQKELSDITNISLRSIQRIENAQVEPRMHTLKTLASKLDLPLETIAIQSDTEKTENIAKKIIISLTIIILSILLFAAFLIQHPRFPETPFEAFLAWTGLVIFLSAFFLHYWRVKN